MAEQPTAPKPASPAAAPAPAAAQPPQPTHKDGRLTRAGMEDVISRKGSVLHNGVIISTIDGLPSEAELAKGDTDAEAAAQANIDRQRAALDAQEAALKANKAPAPKK